MFKASQGSTVHSVSGHTPGDVYLCRCDKPALVLTSNTPKNPGRQFYKCPDDFCRLFKWKDEVPSPSPPSQQPNTPQGHISGSTSPFSTPTAQRTQSQPQPTPQTSPTKRTHDMSTSSTPRSTQRRNVSPGARERRLQAIRQAQAEVEMESSSEPAPSLEKHASVQTDANSDASTDEDDDEQDEDNGSDKFDDSTHAFNAGGRSGEAGGSERAAKRSRIKSEPEETALAPSRSISRGSKVHSDVRNSTSLGAGMLLTPPRSSLREASDDALRPDRSGAESPTNFTKKGGQVARDFYIGTEHGQHASDPLASSSSLNERLVASANSYAEDSQKTISDQSPGSTFDIAVKAMENMTNQQRFLQTVIERMEEEKTQLLLRASVSEKRAKSLEAQLEELKSQNKALQSENQSLTERLGLIQRAISLPPSSMHSNK